MQEGSEESRPYGDPSTSGSEPLPEAFGSSCSEPRRTTGIRLIDRAGRRPSSEDGAGEGERRVPSRDCEFLECRDDGVRRSASPVESGRFQLEPDEIGRPGEDGEGKVGEVVELAKRSLSKNEVVVVWWGRTADEGVSGELLLADSGEGISRSGYSFSPALHCPCCPDFSVRPDPPLSSPKPCWPGWKSWRWCSGALELREAVCTLPKDEDGRECVSPTVEETLLYARRENTMRPRKICVNTIAGKKLISLQARQSLRSRTSGTRTCSPSSCPAARARRLQS